MATIQYVKIPSLANNSYSSIPTLAGNLQQIVFNIPAAQVPVGDLANAKLALDVQMNVPIDDFDPDLGTLFPVAFADALGTGSTALVDGNGAHVAFLTSELRFEDGSAPYTRDNVSCFAGTVLPHLTSRTQDIAGTYISTGNPNPAFGSVGTLDSLPQAGNMVYVRPQTEDVAVTTTTPGSSYMRTFQTHLPLSAFMDLASSDAAEAFPLIRKGDAVLTLNLDTGRENNGVFIIDSIATFPDVVTTISGASDFGSAVNPIVVPIQSSIATRKNWNEINPFYVGEGIQYQVAGGTTGTVSTTIVSVKTSLSPTPQIELVVADPDPDTYVSGLEVTLSRVNPPQNSATYSFTKASLIIPRLLMTPQLAKAVESVDTITYLKVSNTVRPIQQSQVQYADTIPVEPSPFGDSCVIMVVPPTTGRRVGTFGNANTIQFELPDGLGTYPSIPATVGSYLTTGRGLYLATLNTAFNAVGLKLKKYDIGDTYQQGADEMGVGAMYACLLPASVNQGNLKVKLTAAPSSSFNATNAFFFQVRPWQERLPRRMQ